MLISRLTPSVPVIRHRGGERDENGTFADESDSVTLMAIAVAPGGGSDRGERARSGEDIDCIVYFPAGTDVVNSDELTVRGARYRIVVNVWEIDSSSTGGVEVLCVRSQG